MTGKRWNDKEIHMDRTYYFVMNHHRLSFVFFFRVQEIGMNEFRIPRTEVVYGLLPGVRLDVVFPGFPTMKRIEHTAELRFADIKVFQQPSKKQSMILKIPKRSDFDKVDLTYYALKHELNIFI
ncbi:unnamed protein product [Gongylonema pulchrum]|uniref:XRN1_D1 domain-containing protein n=1 Tax=Gongylonema pulchrum TaxID=637853 RepID=A0A183DNM5_9BILA|nr:unnamed protein product [Gongylonema pulchrum]